MSLLPSRNLVDSASSSSERSSSTSSFDHGSISSERPQNCSPPSFRSLRISDRAASSSVAFDNFSGSVAPASDASGPSSQKVNEWEASSDENGPTHQLVGQSLQHANQNPAKLSGFSNGNQTTGSRENRRRTQMVSGNHLLNFHYNPISRSQPRPRAPPPRRPLRRKRYNKDLFLQANYKFVVLDSGDYAPESLDPDKMLNWEDIICVKYLTPFQVQCPICLEDPLCPQITHCGHIFCFPCIMQYLMLGEDDSKTTYSKKCPLCFTLISSNDLYTIQIENVKQYRVGECAEFMLLTRQKDSFVLSQKNCRGQNANNEIQDFFSKFTFTVDVDLSVREAMSDLDSWLARADSGLIDDLEKLPYVCTAIKQLEQRKKYWHVRLASNGFIPNTGEVQRMNSANCVGDRSASVDNLSSDWAETTDTTAEPLYDNDRISSYSFNDNKNVYERFNSFGDGRDRESYNFYQAIDGQLLILHPLNMRCLLNHYGHYDKLPSRIGGKILQLETVTQSEAMRRRYRFLSHFSLTTTFQFCEIDLSGMLPGDALSPFMDEIKNREKQRKRLAWKENREKKKAEAVEFSSLHVPVNLEQTFQDEPLNFSMDDFEALVSPTVTSSSPPNIGGRPSFSNVARLGFASGHDSLGLNLEETSSLPRIGMRHDSLATIGVRNNGAPSFANVASRGKTPEKLDGPKTNETSFANVASRGKTPEKLDGPKANETGKKGKKQSRLLLSTAGSRRY